MKNLKYLFITLIISLNCFANQPLTEDETKEIDNSTQTSNGTTERKVYTVEEAKEMAGKGKMETKNEDADGITYTSLEYLFNEETNTLTENKIERSEKIGGNLGRSFPDNIALPVRANQLSITKVDDINESNYQQVLSEDVAKLIEYYKGYINDGYSLYPIDKVINIVSTASAAAANNKVPSGGYSSAQVEYSYNNTTPSNDTLARNRGNFLRDLIIKIAKFPADKLKVNSSVTTVKSVNIDAVSFAKENKEENNYEVKSTASNTAAQPANPTLPDQETARTNGGSTNGTGPSIPDVKNKNDKTTIDITTYQPGQPPKKERKLLNKILTGIGIGAVVGGAAWGISKLANKNKDNNGASKNIVPAAAVIDPNIMDGWKLITASQTCSPQKFHKNLLDNKIYFSTKEACTPTKVEPTVAATIKPTVKPTVEPVKPKPVANTKPAPKEIIEPDVDVSELSNEQIIQLANSGQTNDNPLNCQKAKFKILHPCSMRGYPSDSISAHPNYKVSLNQGVVKLVGSSTLICQYIENKAMYSIILQKKCEE